MNNNRNLFLIFVALLILFLASRLFDRPSTRSFDQVLIAVDTSKVQEIIIYPKDGIAPILLSRASGSWTCESEGVRSPGAVNAIQSMLNELVSVEPKRLAARSKEKWAEFGVENDVGSRIEVSDGQRILADFIVGRFSFNQQTRQPLSYLRKTKSDDTYVVEGFIGLSFDQSFENFRDKTLIRLRHQEIEKISYARDNEIVELLRRNNRWEANGVPVDSAGMAQYIDKMQSLSGSAFYTGDGSGSKAKLQSLEIYKENGGQTTITLFAPDSQDADFIIHSSLNETAYFTSDSNGIYKTLFGDLSDLIKL